MKQINFINKVIIAVSLVAALSSPLVAAPINLFESVLKDSQTFGYQCEIDEQKTYFNAARAVYPGGAQSIALNGFGYTVDEGMCTEDHNSGDPAKNSTVYSQIEETTDRVAAYYKGKNSLCVKGNNLSGGNILSNLRAYIDQLAFGFQIATPNLGSDPNQVCTAADTLNFVQTAQTGGSRPECEVTATFQRTLVNMATEMHFGLEPFSIAQNGWPNAAVRRYEAGIYRTAFAWLIKPGTNGIPCRVENPTQIFRELALNEAGWLNIGLDPQDVANTQSILEILYGRRGGAFDPDNPTSQSLCYKDSNGDYPVLTGWLDGWITMHGCFSNDPFHYCSGSNPSNAPIYALMDLYCKGI